MQVMIDKSILNVSVSTDTHHCAVNFNSSICVDATYRSTFIATIDFTRSVLSFTPSLLVVPGGTVGSRALASSTNQTYYVAITSLSDGHIDISLPAGSVTGDFSIFSCAIVGAILEQYFFLCRRFWQ
jgi:hypothetical protein